MPPARTPRALTRRTAATGNAPTDARAIKREQILAVAEDLFFRRGYSKTTIADIATRLGVTKPFIYYYFRNKDDLYQTLSWQASVACLTSMHFEPEDQRRAIERLIEGLDRLARSNITYFKAGTFYYRDPGAMQPAFLRKLRNLARQFHEDLCSLLEQARADGDLEYEDTKLTALSVGSVIGFMYVWYKPNGKIHPEDMAGRLTSILLRIVGAVERSASHKPVPGRRGRRITGQR